MSEWISSLTAINNLREENLIKPEQTLAQWAEAGLVRTKAQKGRFSLDEGNERVFPDEPDGNSPWPYIPTDFWWNVNQGRRGSQAHFEAGSFAAQIDYEYGGLSEHIKLYGVEFNHADISAQLKGSGKIHKIPNLEPRQGNAGRKISLEAWSNYGAALAYIAFNGNDAKEISIDGLYNICADALKKSGWEVPGSTTVRDMTRKYIAWKDRDVIPQKA